MKIVINDVPPSNNQYMGNSHNFNQYRREKEKWHWLIKSALNKAEKPARPIEKAIVHITFYFKDKRRRDSDNYSGKMLLDPLVREGVLADDSFANVTLVVSAGHDKNNPRTEIEVRSVEDGEKKEAETHKTEVTEGNVVKKSKGSKRTGCRIRTDCKGA